MKYRSDETNSDEHFENLYWCGLLIYQLGITEDIIALWRAKNLNFDTACGFDVQFLVGGGVEETLDYLDRADQPDGKQAASYLTKCAEVGDFDNLDLWRESRIAYFG